MGLRKKLYYPCRFEFATLGFNLFPSGGALSVISANVGAIVRFVGGTGSNNSIGGASQFFGAAGDRYGGVMDPNLFSGVASPTSVPPFVTDQSGKRRSQQAITAFFQCSSANAPFLAAPMPICVDFVASTSLPITAGPVFDGLPSIDPTTVRRPWLRIKAIPTFAPPFILEGMLYIGRNHSMEI